MFKVGRTSDPCFIRLRGVVSSSHTIVGDVQPALSRVICTSDEYFAEFLEKQILNFAEEKSAKIDFGDIKLPGKTEFVDQSLFKQILQLIHKIRKENSCCISKLIPISSGLIPMCLHVDGTFPKNFSLPK